MCCWGQYVPSDAADILHPAGIVAVTPVSFRNTVPFWCQTDHYTQKRTHNRGALVSTSPLHCFQHSLETLQHPLLLHQNFRSWNKHVVELTFVSQALFILQSPVLQTTATVAHAVLKNAPAGHHDVGMLMLKINLGYGSIGKDAWLYSALSGANYMSIFTSTTSFSGTLWNVVYFDDDSLANFSMTVVLSKSARDAWACSLQG